jgi:hypothetical protein
MEVEISWGSKGGGNNSSIDISWKGLFNRKSRQLEKQVGKDFCLEGVKIQLEPGRRWKGRKGAKKINEFSFLCIDLVFYD